MTRTASGTEITLASGGYRARLVTVGAGLAGLTLGEHDLVVPHAASELPRGWLGKTLVPWPNRISGGTYSWAGSTYHAPVNEPQTGAALHGLMGWVDWSVVHADSDSATLGAFIAPRYWYPWALQSWVTYALHEETGLSVTITSTNVGSEAAPYGASSHPYLTLDLEPCDAYSLEVPASSALETDSNLSPVARRPVGELDLDFRSARLIGARRIDHAFTDLPEGPWSVSLRSAESGLSVSLESDAPWVQVYSGEEQGRRGVAVEAMTCAPDAFNSGEGLIVLEPGESASLTFGIRGSLAD
jgi:aldose 1-epimerase